MRGVSKVKGKELYEAYYQNKKVGRLRKNFKNESDAKAQRIAWEQKYGNKKPGISKGQIKKDYRGKTIGNFFILDYLPDNNKEVLVRNNLTGEIKTMNLRGIIHKSATGIPLNVANYISGKEKGTGIRYRKDIKKWEAHIHQKNKYKSLGTFDTKQEAIDARKEAEEKYFKPILDKYKKENPNDSI